MTEPVRLAAGDRAPAFNLSDQTGTKHRLSHSKGRRVMVFFYPKANTGGCTTQACGLRDIADEIGDVQIFGISPDEPAAQAKWDAKHEFGFPLLSDPDGSAAKKFDVLSKRGPFSARVTFVIDSKGVIRHIDDGVNVDSHGEDLIEVIERLP